MGLRYYSLLRGFRSCAWMARWPSGKAGACKALITGSNPVLASIFADMAQLVEHHLAKVGVAGSNPVVRSRNQRKAPLSCGAFLVSASHSDRRASMRECRQDEILAAFQQASYGRRALDTLSEKSASCFFTPASCECPRTTRSQAVRKCCRQR